MVLVDYGGCVLRVFGMERDWSQIILRNRCSSLGRDDRGLKEKSDFMDGEERIDFIDMQKRKRYSMVFYWEQRERDREIESERGIKDDF